MLNRRAFTMIEFAIAALMFAVVGGVAFYFLKMGYDARQVANMENEILSDQDRAVKIISELLDQAIRVDGPTRTVHPTIVEAINSNNANFEEISVITIRHPHVMTRVQGLVENAGTYKFQLFSNPLPDSNDPEENLRRQTMIDMQETVKSYFPKTQANIPVYFQSSGQVNLLSITPPQTPDMQVTVNIQPLLNSGMTESRVKSLFENDMRVGMTSKVRIYVDNIDPQTGLGVLKIDETFGDQPVQTKEILKGVSKLQFLYAFDSYHRTNASDMFLPNGSLDKPDASDSSYRQEANCSLHETLCVDQSDLASVRVVLSTSRNVDMSRAYATNERGFSMEDGTMKLLKVHFAVPKNFGNKTSQWDTVTSLACQNPNNRCGVVSGCEEYFNSDIVDSPRWEGYARHVLSPNPSNYCLCGTTNRPSSVSAIDFKLPETQAGYDAVPFFNAATFSPWPATSASSEFIDMMKASPANRVLACSSHFTDYIWAFKNPFHYIWHNGIKHTPANDVQYRSNGSGSSNAQRGNIVWHFPAYQTFRNDYDASSAGTFWRDHVDCRLGYDNLSYNFRLIWGGGAPQNDSNGRMTHAWIPLGRDGGNARIQKMTGGVVRPWEEKCLCQSSTGNLYAEWACNHMTTASNNLSTMGGAGCPDTWDGELVDAASPPNAPVLTIPPPANGQIITPANHKKVFKVKTTASNPAFPDGLKDANLALLCQCLQDRYYESHLPVSEGWAVSNYWDFREAGSLTTPSGESGPTGIDLTAYAGSFPPLNSQCQSTVDTFPYSGSPHWSGPPYNGNGIASIATKTQTAFYRTDAGTIQSVTGRCDNASGGSLQKVLSPNLVPATNLTEIRNQFAQICTTNGADKPYCTGGTLNPDTAFVNRWAAFCNPNVFKEIGGGSIGNCDGWYKGPGVQQARQYLTGVGVGGALPTWCGGNPQQGQGGT